MLLTALKNFLRRLELAFWRQRSDRLYDHLKANRSQSWAVGKYATSQISAKRSTTDNLVIFFSSRNNYDLLAGEWLKKVNFLGFQLINVDDGSSTAELKKGRHICKEHRVVFLKNQGKGIQWATKTAIDYLAEIESEAKWLIHFTHDNFPLTNDFFLKLSSLINTDMIQDFGCIGFNHMELKKTLAAFKTYYKGGDACGLMGLARLSAYDSATPYVGESKSFSWKWQRWGKPFLIESVLTPAFGINITLFNRFVAVTDQFRLFLWSDDLCFQFLLHGIHNLVIPQFYTVNRQDIKAKYSIPVKSASTIGTEDGRFFYSTSVDHLANWQKRWGWDIRDRGTFSNVRGRYARTALESYFVHDLRNGPLKSFPEIKIDLN